MLFGVRSLYRTDVLGRRQIIDDRVQEELHTLVLQGRAAQNRNEFETAGAFPDKRFQFRFGNFLAGQELVHHRFVLLDDLLEALGAEAAVLLLFKLVAQFVDLLGR